MRRVLVHVVALILFILCARQAALHFLRALSQKARIEDSWSEHFDHQHKLQLVWDSVKAESGRSNSWPPLLEFLQRFVLVRDDFTKLALPLTFRENPATKKILHTFASTARVRFRFNDLANTLYSGLFAEAELEAIMTASTGNRIVGNQTLQFGWAFKFFRTGTFSSNILTLNSLSGELVWNLFGQMTCNHNSLSESFILSPHSIGWTAFPGQNGLSNMARTTLQGEHVPSPSFPYALCFTPTPGSQARLQPAKPFAHTFEQLHAIRENEHLLDVWAITHPKVLEDPSSLDYFSLKIGEVYSVSKFYKSLFSDQRLFFQHQPFEEDLKLRPDWKQFMTPMNLMNEGALFAYRGLFSRESPSLESLQYTLSSLSRAVVNLFRDPVVRRNFIISEIGVGRNAPYFSEKLGQLASITPQRIGPMSGLSHDQVVDIGISLFESLSTHARSTPTWLLHGHSFPAWRYLDDAEQAMNWVKFMSQLKN